MRQSQGKSKKYDVKMREMKQEKKMRQRRERQQCERKNETVMRERGLR